MNTAIKYLALIILYIGSMIEIFRQMRQSRQMPAQNNQDKGSLKFLYGAITAGCCVGVPFAFSTFGQMKWGQPYLALLGLLINFSGIIIRGMAIRTLGRHFTYAVTIKDHHQLVQQGLYRCLRHPAYTGGLLIFLGIGLAVANWISLLSLFLCPCVGVAVRMTVEEKALITHFGAQYKEYQNRTWRIIPWVY